MMLPDPPASCEPRQLLKLGVGSWLLHKSHPKHPQGQSTGEDPFIPLRTSGGTWTLWEHDTTLPQSGVLFFP